MNLTGLKLTKIRLGAVVAVFIVLAPAIAASPFTNSVPGNFY